MAMRTRYFVAIAALLCGTVDAQEKETATFRTGVNYVQIQVRAVDAKGVVVRDLQIGDFVIIEDGIPQVLESFSRIDFPKIDRNIAVAQSPQTSVGRAEEHATPARIYVFLLDDYHLSPQYTSRAKALVRGFINDRMGVDDVGAVVYMSGVAGQGLTNDRTQLLASLERFRGSFDYGEPASVREIKARSVLKTITQMSSNVGKIGGCQKSFIYVGLNMGCRIAQDMFPDLQDPSVISAEEKKFGNVSSAGTGAPPDAANTILCNDAIADTVRSALRFNVTVYSIDPRGLQTPDWVSPTVDGRGGPDRARVRNSLVESPRPSVFDGFYVLAEQTGGFAISGTNAFNRAVDRIVAESSTYYLIGYYSSNQNADGRFRFHKVIIKRPGVKALHRSGYLGPQ
jgi:VWFA-related protein